MNVKVVIPARYGSSRLPGKPLLTLLDKPVIWHVIERCKEAGIEQNDIFVATDDQRIIDALRDESIQVVLTSSEHQSGTDRINEVAQIKGWDEDTIIVNVQGDEPMIPYRLIQRIVSFTQLNPSYHITTAVVPLVSQDDFVNPNVVKAIIGYNGRALYFTRSPSPLNRDNSSDLSLAKRHIGIYAYRASALKQFCSYSEDELEQYEKLEQLRALSHGMSIGATIFDGFVPHGIDTIDDYENIKKIMEENIL
ncbi:3-deoxy-D-manno-octulosonate cytidylyltransferase [Aliivibrio fischeri ES114]|uniref:3-deoxy-manno-octulosonate cytidylyltransferase n=1 Tax=Aliivibrio fischeri (strain ATCC 700601 / ES114) TaxID=312309 RepID=Q5E8H3_ALIF1|nr:3-deoxy-manno-octulosonate cytidylyltransferase [Aliivibrio fischeri]AAW84673.1 3-deoxy-D-manno-octulosonate cytidylyltransferase [Aliivibrio fischeri ES114]KLU78878.1 3-deoxy-manno-octulosonate cytidylyltransferase [Aliivibrio fischeri]MUI52507.1 3-deoxy-manno-octulosonate cytidylyltransferase [Aliivibrio fischeri]